MTVWVHLVDGEVRKYNRGSMWVIGPDWFEISSGDPVDKNMIAKIRTNLVKMAEFEEPCSIVRVKPKRKVAPKRL